MNATFHYVGHYETREKLKPKNNEDANDVGVVSAYLRLLSGGEYLFQAKDDEEMNGWVRGIAEVTQEAAGAAGPSRAQTLPASSFEKKDEPKKRGFFTLKKK
jgi:hypothetical protein